jgi:hypothetical protein
MRAVEKRNEIRAASAQWRKAFADGATIIGQMDGRNVLWHEALGIWGYFGKISGKGGIKRDYNTFGQKPVSFRSNTVVEINPPPQGIDQNLQGVFAIDPSGCRWILHQGRMSVPGSRVTEQDFIEATGQRPIAVTFSEGPPGEYHKVAPLDHTAAMVQEALAAFVALCARARLAKTAPARAMAGVADAQNWERGLSPEAIGSFDVAPRGAAKGSRRHGEVWRALSAELTRRGVRHSNDRVAQYGPDLFTFGIGANVLFEIKSAPSPRDIFEAVGQLHIYERLLNGKFRKVLVVPEGMAQALKGPVTALRIDVLEYRRQGRHVLFPEVSLSTCLGG